MDKLEFRDPPGKRNTQTLHIHKTRRPDPTWGCVGLGQFCIRLTLAGDVAQEVSLSNKLFLLLCSCVHAALQSSIELSFHNLPTLLFFSQHDGLLFSLSLSHLSSNAGTLSLPLIYHFLLPLSSLSFAISLPVRLCSPLSDFLSGSVTLILFLLSSSSSSSLPLPEDLLLPPAPVAPPAPRSITHVHATRTPLAHSYSTCVSLLGVAWGNQIHLQIYLYILIPSLTQGLFFSLFFSSPHCVFGQVSEYNGSLFLFSFF